MSLDDLATKMLNFMLERPDGCDAWITEDSFVVQFGWNDAHHKYLPRIAPSVVAWLRESAPSGFLPAGSLPYWGGMPNRWHYGPRLVWFDENAERLSVMIRDAGDRTEIGDRPLPFPAPIEKPPEYFVGTHACPHCGVVPDRYRKLGDGGLVCLACGASSRDPR